MNLSSWLALVLLSFRLLRFHILNMSNISLLLGFSILRFFVSAPSSSLASLLRTPYRQGISTFRKSTFFCRRTVVEWIYLNLSAFSDMSIRCMLDYDSFCKSCTQDFGTVDLRSRDLSFPCRKICLRMLLRGLTCPTFPRVSTSQAKEFF